MLMNVSKKISLISNAIIYMGICKQNLLFLSFSFLDNINNVYKIDFLEM